QFMVTRSELSEGALIARQDIRIYHQRLLPRVDARKPDKTESHFYSANLQIADNSNLCDVDDRPLVPNLQVNFYFLLETTDEFMVSPTGKALKLAIDLLPDTGIGGERSVGCGQFLAVDYVDFPEVRSGKSGCYATVSLCTPASSSELENFHSYETIVRGGRETAQEGPLQMVRMMAEGAVSIAKPDGDIVNISPSGVHTHMQYLRLGKPISLPVIF
ncbi:MAG: hypothetical protein ABIO24_02900, partial [Saprospiraceae bacterium]